VPDNDLLAVGGGQHMLFGLGKSGRVRRGAPDRRDRKQHLALPEIQHGHAAEINHGKDDDDPFQYDHRSVTGVCIAIACGVSEAWQRRA